MLLFPHFLVRHILASLHFNENVQREAQAGKDGDNYYKVSYPKFKLGEEVVRDVASPPTYGKYLGTFNQYQEDITVIWNHFMEIM